MARPWHHHANLSQTSSKTAPHLVQELALDATKLPMPSPSTRPLPSARIRRSPAGRQPVEHLACVPAPEPPRPAHTRPARPRPPAHAHVVPLPRRNRARASLALHVADHARPHAARAARTTTGPPHHPLTPLPPCGYKNHPLAAAQQHTTPLSSPGHAHTSPHEHELELELSRAPPATPATVLWPPSPVVSGHATATQRSPSTSATNS